MTYTLRRNARCKITGPRGASASWRLLFRFARSNWLSVQSVPGQLHYNRVLIKLSGEALSGATGGSGIDTATLKATAEDLEECTLPASNSAWSLAAATSSAA